MATSASASSFLASMTSNTANDSSTRLWQQMLRDCSVRSKLATAQLVLVGDAESGKSALLSRLDEKQSHTNQLYDELQPPTSDLSTNDPSNEASTSSLPSHPQAMSALFAYTAMEVLDPRAKRDTSNTTHDTSDDIIAKINTWCLNELKMKELLAFALKPDSIAQTVVAVVLDLARPWTIKSSLEQWTLALEGALLQQINTLPLDARNALYNRIKDHILTYEDPSIDHSVPKTLPDVTTKKEFLEEGVLAKNLGVPFLLIMTKADLRPENSIKMDYIEYVVRQFAIRYGAAIVYTSAKASTNIDLLRKYILHRAFPEQFKFDDAPQLIERSAIFVPSGYDSFQLIDQSLLGSQPRWSNDKPFEKMVPPPSSDDTTEAEDASSMLMNDVRIDSHDKWLEKLEKAAGAGLEELQKQSIEASKKSEAVAAARRAAAERRKKDDKDVSSKHLANFFNDLLSRPEKTKSARSLADLTKKREKSTTAKTLAEQELELLAKRT